MVDVGAMTPRAPGGPSAAEVRPLVVLTGVLASLTVLHDLDHLRQGRALPPALYLVAVTALASLAATLTVLLRYPTWAIPAAVLQGVATNVGVVAVHVAPAWSSFTDSYGAAGADTASWAIIIAMMATGCTLAVCAAWPRPGPIDQGVIRPKERD